MDFIFNDEGSVSDQDSVRKMVSILDPDTSTDSVLATRRASWKRTYRRGFLVKDVLGPLIMAMTQAQHGIVVDSLQVDLVTAWSGKLVYRDADFTYPYPVVASISDILEMEIFCCTQRKSSSDPRVFALEVWSPRCAASRLLDLPAQLTKPAFHALVASIE